MPARDAKDRLRPLPQIQRLLERPSAQSLIAASSHATVAASLRDVLAGWRARLLADDAAALPDPEALVALAAARIATRDRPVLRRVINATGIILHTNLGRAPLAEEALQAVADMAQGYSNLEFDLDAGQRGARMQGIEPLLCELTGAEAGIAVNNAAAAVLLALSALAAGGEVIISRGELVEIGGGFRIPDVIRQGGARLVEVGTTNKTRIGDYSAAITPDTRMLLKVHASNYRILGFTAEASLPQLAELARERSLILMQDLGSGAMLGRPGEPTARDLLLAGADLVAFSGDKLFGGPQAGMVVGTHAAIDPLRRHPLLRAVRLDKMSLAALEATLRLYRDPQRAARRIPALRMLGQTEAVLQARAERVCDLLADSVAVCVEPSAGYAGGGALPGSEIPSRAVILLAGDAEQTAARLRAQAPPVVGRIHAGCLQLDMLAVADEEVPALVASVLQAVA